MIRRFCIFIFFSLFPLHLMAAASYQVNNGANLDINEHGVCQNVSNAAANGLAIFVPTTDPSEWLAFRTNPPTGITLSACNACPTGVDNLTASQTWTVPAGCTSLVIKAWGGGGGGGGTSGGKSGDGGAGGYAFTNTLTISAPGSDSYTFVVGGGGNAGECATQVGGTGTYNGGTGGALSAGSAGAGAGGSAGGSGISGYNGGAGGYGGGGGGAGSVSGDNGGGGGAATVVTDDQVPSTILIAGGGGGGGGGENGSGVSGGAGSPGCSATAGGTSANRGGGGGAGACSGTNTAAGTGVTPSNNLEAGPLGDRAVGGIKGSTCLDTTSNGRSGAVRFEYSP